MIKEFISLKGILALMIFIHHLGLYDGGGSLAVAMFFMLGGFLSVLGYKDKVTNSDFSYKKYLIGKAIKFYPMHWLLLLAAIPLTFYGTKHIFSQLAVLGVNALLLQSWIPVQKVYFSFNAVSWYLSDTIALVAVFPFILKWMLRSEQKQKSAVSIVIAIAYIALWYVIPEEHVHKLFYICPLFRLIDYMVGMYAALLYLKLREKEIIKQIVNNHYKSLLITRSLCFLSLLALSCLNSNLILHSAIYMPLECMLLIIIGLMGGVFCGCLFYKSLDLSVLRFS